MTRRKIICTKCGRQPPDTNFTRRTNGNWHSWCQPCQRAHNRGKSRNIRAENKQLRAALERWPCTECGLQGLTYDRDGKPTLCNVCDGTGLHPIACTALAI